MRVAIVDDDDIYRDCIRQCISEHYPTFEVSEYESGTAFLASDIKGYAIVFLDIVLGDENGIDIATKMRERGASACIFFISNYAQYISESFKTMPFQYILKPIDEDVLLRELERAVISIERSNKQLDIKTLDGIEYVPVKDILYIEYSGRKMDVHTRCDIFSTYGTMKGILSRVADYDCVRCHSGYIVNIVNIRHIKGSDITMINGDHIPISRRYLASTREMFLRYKAGMER